MKKISPHKLISRNGHEFRLGNKDQTKIYLLVFEKSAIGGYSFPDSDELLVGSVYSVEGKTLKEVVGMDLQTWRKQW